MVGEEGAHNLLNTKRPLQKDNSYMILRTKSQESIKEMETSYELEQQKSPGLKATEGLVTPQQ